MERTRVLDGGRFDRRTLLRLCGAGVAMTLAGCSGRSARGGDGNSGGDDVSDGTSGDAGGTSDGGGTGSDTAAGTPDAGVDATDWESMTLGAQLEAVRRATEKYDDVGVAEAAGYEFQDALGFVCWQGSFWDRPGWEADTDVDPLEPESLLYVDDDDGWKLGAVTYLVPIDPETGMPDEPPDLFNDEAEEAEELLGFFHEAHSWTPYLDDTGVHPGRMWTLHVWVHQENPDGVFSHINERFQEMPGCTSELDTTGDRIHI